MNFARMAEEFDSDQPDYDFEGFENGKEWVRELLKRVNVLESVLGKKLENLGKKVKYFEENYDGLGKKVESLGKKVKSFEEEKNGCFQKVNSMEKDRAGLVRRVKSLEVEIGGMREVLTEINGEVEMVKEKENKMREDNKIFQSRVKYEISEVRRNNDDIREAVSQVEGKQNEWGQKTKEAENSLMKIMEEQEKEKREMKNKIVSIIKEKKKIVRDTIEKVKSVVIFGLKEEKVVDREQRERKEKENIKKVVEIVTEGDSTEAMRAIEEFHRIGKFEENKDRPIRIKFATQVQAEEIINGAWRLARVEQCRNVWINRDLDEDERGKLRELVQEAKQKNMERSEAEKMQFYWKVRDWNLKKMYVRK